MEKEIPNYRGKNLEAPAGAFRHFWRQEFFQSPLVHWVLIGALLLNIVTWGTLSYFIRPIDLPVVLHYNVYFGVDMVGDWWQIFLLPLVGTCFLVVDTGLAYWFYRKKERIAAYLLLLASLIIQVGVAIASAGIISINY